MTAWCDKVPFVNRMSLNSNDPSQAKPQNLVVKRIYNEDVQAEFLELQSDIESLLQQLQSLSRQRPAQSGAAQ